MKFSVAEEAGEPAARHRKVTISERVQAKSGLKVASEVPRVMSSSTAHFTASVYQVPSGTSVKSGASVSPGSVVEPPEVPPPVEPPPLELLLTVSTQVAVLPPSSVVTVMLAVPVPTAVTLPPSTVATDSLSLLQVTFWLVASSGSTVAVRVRLSPTVREAVSWSSFTPVTATAEVLALKEARRSSGFLNTK